MSATFWILRKKRAAKSAPKQEKAEVKVKAPAKKGGGKSGK